MFRVLEDSVRGLVVGPGGRCCNVRNQPTDPDLKKQANRIHPGSSDTNDTDAINQLKDRCKSIGYRFPAR